MTIEVKMYFLNVYLVYLVCNALYSSVFLHLSLPPPARLSDELPTILAHANTSSH